MDKTDLIAKTKELVSNNIENSSELTTEQKEAIVSYVGSVLWFATDVQSNVIVSSKEYYKASNLSLALKAFLEE